MAQIYDAQEYLVKNTELLFDVNESQKYGNYPPSFTPFDSKTYFGSAGSALDKVRSRVDPLSKFVDKYNSAKITWKYS